MKLLVLTVLTFLFAGHDCMHRFTPLDTDNHPCKAENLKLTNRYVLKVSKSQKKNSWNSIAKKTNKIFDKILPYEDRAEFCLIFRLFFGQWSFKKNCFWDLLTFSIGFAYEPTKMIFWLVFSLIKLISNRKLTDLNKKIFV